MNWKREMPDCGGGSELYPEMRRSGSYIRMAISRFIHTDSFLELSVESVVGRRRELLVAETGWVSEASRVEEWRDLVKLNTDKKKKAFKQTFTFRKLFCSFHTA